MRLPCTIRLLALAALLAVPASAASAAASQGEGPVFHLMSHTLDLGSEAVGYFTWRPKELAPGQNAPLLVAISPGGEEALHYASRTRLFETAEAQGARLVLVEGPMNDGGNLSRVLDEVLARVG